MQTPYAAAGAATSPPARAAAAAAKAYEWADIRAYCAKHKQANVMNNQALKYFRWAGEDPAGVPTATAAEGVVGV